MKLKALNKLDPKFGYPDNMEYKDEKFHGHQIGVAIAILNDDNTVHENLMKKDLQDSDELLQELLGSDAKLIEEDITQLDDKEELHKRKVVYLPYAVIDSPCFKPTINFDCIDDASNSYHDVAIEILFVADGLNRYVVLHGKTRNMSMFDMVRTAFDDEEQLVDMGFRKGSEEDEQGSGWYLDMYNEAGASFDVALGYDGDSILSNTNSIRLIGIETFIDGEDDNQQEEEMIVYKE